MDFAGGDVRQNPPFRPVGDPNAKTDQGLALTVRAGPLSDAIYPDLAQSNHASHRCN